MVTKNFEKKIKIACLISNFQLKIFLMIIKNKIWILFYFLERRVKEAAFLRSEEKKSAPVAIETRRDSAEYSDSINSLSSDDIVSTKTSS